MIAPDPSAADARREEVARIIAPDAFGNPKLSPDVPAMRRAYGKADAILATLPAPVGALDVLRRCGEVLKLARPIVEADVSQAQDYADADWQGMSRTALEAIDDLAQLCERVIAGEGESGEDRISDAEINAAIRHGFGDATADAMEREARLAALEKERGELREAFTTLLVWAEEAEAKLLVGDEGCFWPVEEARSFRAKIEEIAG